MFLLTFGICCGPKKQDFAKLKKICAIHSHRLKAFGQSADSDISQTFPQIEDQPFFLSNLYLIVLTESNGLLNCFSGKCAFTPKNKHFQAVSFVMALKHYGLILIEVISKGQDTAHEDLLYLNTAQYLEVGFYFMFHDFIIVADGSLLAGITLIKSSVTF